MPATIVALKFDAYQPSGLRYNEAWYAGIVERVLREGGVTPEMVHVSILKVLDGEAARMVSGILSVSADLPESELRELHGLVSSAATAAGLDPVL